ncbi:hypothetical protein [Roseovarius sp.]|uniref:hypothetical protein n=1 Tax=Roseovarius sp. TaxID=1486281 RepID=UPI0035192C43
MSLDGFLTFFGLVLAAYAVLDPITRLRLRLNATGQVVLFAIFGTTILFFQFILPILNILPQNVSVWFVELGFGQPSDLMSNEKISFVLTAVWCILSLSLYSLSRPSGRKLIRLFPLVNRLYDERRYLELIILVAPYIEQLRLYRHREHPLLKLRDWSARAGTTYLPQLVGPNRDGWNAPRILRPGLRQFSKCLPNFTKRTFSAEAIIETVAKSPCIRRELQVHQAEFSVEFFRNFHHNTYDEFDKFIMDSMQNSDSFLREDLRATVNTDGETYALTPDRVTLFGFIGDIDFAQQSGIWRPVGEAALKALREDSNYISSLSEVPPFEDEDLFDDITYSAIHFFDILVTRAAVQGVQDNFWLMYVAIIVEKILGAHDLTRVPNHYDGEFPTLGVRNIWEAQHRLQNWVELAWRLPKENSHRSPLTVEEARDVCAIPYWAAHSLCRALRAIIQSDNVTESFKVERLGSFVRTASQIPRTGQSSYLRQFLANGLVVGPFDIEFDNLSVDLHELLPQTDQVYRANFPELWAAMNV